MNFKRCSYLFSVLVLVLLTSCLSSVDTTDTSGLAKIVDAVTTSNGFTFSIGDRVGVISGTNITVTMPSGTTNLNLTPTIVIPEGASISPEAGVAHDFSSPVIYTLTTADNSTKKYTVTVMVAASDAKDITAFSIGENAGVISGTNITVTIPFGMSFTNLLMPTVAFTGSSLSPESEASSDFSSPVTYTVTAEDNSTKAYTVTVAVAEKTQTYILREVGPAGGWIFYDKGSYSDGWRYLEAAPNDQSTGVRWSNGSKITTGADETAIGTGKTNTTNIVEVQGAGTYAAILCKDLKIANEGILFSDWFLPSKDELNQMNIHKALLGSFGNGYLWSSSEYTSGTAWCQSFSTPGNDVQTGQNKIVGNFVRAIRAF